MRRLRLRGISAGCSVLWLATRRKPCPREAVRCAATRLAADLGRWRAGGNCFDFIDKHGIRVSQYGVHLFHTQARGVASAPLPEGRCDLRRAPPAERARVGLRQQVVRVDALRAQARARTAHAMRTRPAPRAWPRAGSRASPRRAGRAHAACAPPARRVKGRVDGKIVPIPPSQETVNTLFNANVHTEEEMEARPS